MSPGDSNPYDDLPYAGQPFPQTHPARLAAMARLFGLQSPDVGTSRVLELGCASGDNLIPLAVAMPGARFTGVDLSARQIETGRRTVAAVGLTNIELLQKDIASVGGAAGTFDYIIAHGVYSWVPAPIREKLFAICRENLAPNGVAYVSYKTLPGWSIHATLRELMLRQASAGISPAERMRGARAVLDVLGEHAPAGTPYGALLREQIEPLRDVPDGYLYHDHLEAVSHPVYFHRFVAEAEAHGLQYLSEAGLGGMGPGQLSPQAAAAIRTLAPDFIGSEQFVDVLVNRSFRQSLLVHAGAPIERRAMREALASFSIASPARSVSRTTESLAAGVPESFEAPNATSFATSIALTKSALRRLFDRWPDAMPFRELHAMARTGLGLAPANARFDEEQRVLGEELLRAYAAGIVELRLWTPALVATPGERPVASALARHQAVGGGPATNLLHMRVNLDAYTRALLPLLDGTRDVPSLLAAMRDAVPGPVAQGDPALNLGRNLNRLAKAALLLA